MTWRLPKPDLLGVWRGQDWSPVGARVHPFVRASHEVKRSQKKAAYMYVGIRIACVPWERIGTGPQPLRVCRRETCLCL